MRIIGIVANDVQQNIIRHTTHLLEAEMSLAMGYCINQYSWRSMHYYKHDDHNTLVYKLTLLTEKNTIKRYSMRTFNCPSRGGVIRNALRFCSGALYDSKNLNLDDMSAVSTVTSSTGSLARTTSFDTCLVMTY